MGQAKLRGTREQRVEQAIARNKAEAEARERKAAERWAALTPEQKKAELLRRNKVGAFMAMATAMLMGSTTLREEGPEVEEDIVSKMRREMGVGEP